MRKVGPKPATLSSTLGVPGARLSAPQAPLEAPSLTSIREPGPSARPGHGGRQLLRPSQLPTRADYEASLPTERLQRAEVGALLRKASRRLGVHFRADWKSSSTRIEVRAGHPEISVPGGLLRTATLSLDGLALILCHEAAHHHGAKDECAADDWAVRQGWPRLLGQRYEPRRALLAAYSALADQISESHPLDPTRTPAPAFESYVTSYAPLQERFGIYQLGILGLPAPTWKQRPEEEAQLLRPAAAALVLETTPAVLDALKGRPKAPRSAGTGDGQVWLEDDLIGFRTRVRNLAQIAIAQEERQPGTTPDERIVAHAADFGEHWARDPAFRDACYLAWPFPEGTGLALLAHLSDRLPPEKLAP